MKKVIFSAAAFGLVSVSSMALAPTTAEAIPAFARQTGAACLSCHFQTFPAINSFGRAFKMGSFTDVGDEALVEDDNLSLPAVLNAALVIRGNYTNTNTTGKASKGVYNIPSETPLLVAGRIGTNSGAFVEFGNAGAGGVTVAASTGTTAVNNGAVSVGNWQLLNSFDIGGFKVGVGAHNSGFGGSAVLEVSNVFGQHGGKLAGADVSAIQGAGFGNSTGAIGAWVGNDLGYVQFALVAPSSAFGGGLNIGTTTGKLVRAVATLDVGGWDTLIGFGNVTGNAGKGDGAGATTKFRQTMDLQFVDLQMQGEVGDTSVGVYADWAHAKGKSAVAGGTTRGNFYGASPDGVTANTAGNKWDGYSIRAEAKPLEHVLFGIGYGYQKFTNGVTTNADDVKKIFHLAATYEIYQNFELNLVYNSTRLNGGTKAAPTSSTTRETILEFEAVM